MKRIFFVMALILMLPLTVGIVGTAYAEEPARDDTQQTESIDDVSQENIMIENTEEATAKITEYIIAGVLGLFGTSAAAIVFRSSLKGLVGVVKGLVDKLKTDKKVTEEDVKTLKNEVLSAIASLENLKQELVNTNNEEYKKLEREIQILKDVIFALATGTKELVVNGTAESISNIMREVVKEVSADAK